MESAGAAAAGAGAAGWGSESFICTSSGIVAAAAAAAARSGSAGVGEDFVAWWRIGEVSNMEPFLLRAQEGRFRVGFTVAWLSVTALGFFFFLIEDHRFVVLCPAPLGIGNPAAAVS